MESADHSKYLTKIHDYDRSRFTFSQNEFTQLITSLSDCFDKFEDLAQYLRDKLTVYPDSGLMADCFCLVIEKQKVVAKWMNEISSVSFKESSFDSVS